MQNFWKMHGLGNDFVILDCRSDGLEPTASMVKKIARRHRGVGCDLLVTLLTPTLPGVDLAMRLYNADGSEAEACGNATRCVAQLFLDASGKNEVLFQTKAGLLPVWRAGKSDDGLPLYSVNIGKPEFAWDKIPLARVMDTLRLDLTVAELSHPSAVNVGNPHAVFFVADALVVDLAYLGPQIEHHSMFPQRINVEICQVLERDTLRMRVWERGVGITEACGSGAAATLVAAVRRGLADRKAEVVLDGGSLWIEWRADDQVIMTGTASAVYSGMFDKQFLAEQA